MMQVWRELISRGRYLGAIRNAFVRVIKADRGVDAGFGRWVLTLMCWGAKLRQNGSLPVTYGQEG